ncbi:hypothetical protein [Bradyrhizobium sp. CCGUVB23]|uniref:hypothetical protein n=1 Tax=Bradyrhizobium sp. CCGUVB23 TaxID=2949630 RepID=UPI0020B2CCF8|nr:hypothetical protein [Bradyrhizobium sp. CCGUVB23]MCP3463369.1 hypothetical protein [Bradyrhizobium sp. CCGUVB23]
MYRYIARENIDRFLELLNDDSLASDRRAVVTKLLIDEENKLARDAEQLGFAEMRAAKGRERLHRAREQLAEAHPHNHPQLERLVDNFEAIQKLLDGFCHQFQSRVNLRL